MTPAEVVALPDDQLANLWATMHPRTLQKQTGMSDRVLRVLMVRVSRLRAKGWTIKSWRLGVPWKPVDTLPLVGGEHDVR